MRQQRGPRVIRGVVGASIATFLALVSHVGAGGSMPGWVGIALPLALATAVCVLLAGRTLSLPRLALSVVISQTLFHALFVLGTGGTGSASTADPHAGHTIAGIQAQLAGAASGTVSLAHSGAAMWLGHAIAAAVTIAALYRGERALRGLLALARRLGSRLRRLLDAPAFVPAASRPRIVPPVLVVRPAQFRFDTGSRSRRGPPAFRTV